MLIKDMENVLLRLIGVNQRLESLQYCVMVVVFTFSQSEIISPYPSRNKIVALTKNGYIQRYDFYTGELISSHLSSLWSDCKFR